jgi:transketolase
MAEVNKLTTKIATRDAYGKTLAKLGETNSNIVVLDADLSKSTKTCDFAAKFPERFINVGIAEQNLIGISAGLAASGKIPVASTFAMFAAGRAFEVIRNSVCYPKLNVKICATHAGITVGEDGASHQAIEDMAIMRAIPNMTVISPADGPSTEALLKAAIEYKGPVYMRLGRSAVPVLYPECESFEIGKGKTLKDGTDVTIIATGIMVCEAMAAAAELEENGVSARVIDIHTIKPIDEDIIVKAAQETGAIVTVEEHNVIGGLGSAVSEVVSKKMPVRVAMVGIEDTFGESGSPAELLVKYGLTKSNIIEKVMGVIK